MGSHCLAKTKLMAKMAELERTQQGASALEERLKSIGSILEETSAALADFDELTVRQLVSNIKVLDRDSLLVRFKDGTELVRQKG